MHSNYILSPQLKEKVEAVPSSSEFWTEHAALVAEHEQAVVRDCFKNSLELAWEMQSYSAGLIHNINALLENGNYPSWLLWWMVDNLWDLDSWEVSWFTRKIRTGLNDIALATAHFFTDDLLCHPEERVSIDYRDYGFETELEFITCEWRKVFETVIFSLSLEDAIKMIEAILFLINKQSTFRTMPRTGYNFVTKYFHELSN
jgi:hypothetical protein